jgi:hypothetical protein
MGLGEARLGSDLPVGAAGSGQLIGAPDDGGLGLVEAQRRWVSLADDPVRRAVATWHAQAPTLRPVALADPLGELAAVGLGLLCLADELIPVVRVAREDPLVGEEHGHTRLVELVFDGDEGLL